MILRNNDSRVSYIKEKTINSKDLSALNKDIDDTKKGTKLIQQLSGKSTSNMSTDEIMKLTRGKV